MAMPDFLILGAARCGTTALAGMLAQHPAIYFCAPKEPHFLAFAGRPVNFSGPGDETMMNRVAITDPAQYERLFAGARDGQLRGEGSVSSLYYHQSSIENIRRFCPRAKMIAILRHPIERAFSSYLYMVARGFEPESNFVAAVDDEPRRIADGWHHIWHYAELGLYSQQIAAFQRAFPAEQLKVLLFDDLHDRPDEAAREIYEWLDVDPTFRPDTSLQVNRSGVPKSGLVQGVIRQLQRLPRTKAVLKRIVPWSLRERIRNANLAHPTIDAAAVARLADYYRDDVRQLASLLDRDLAAWESGAALDSVGSVA